MRTFRVGINYLEFNNENKVRILSAPVSILNMFMIVSMIEVLEQNYAEEALNIAVRLSEWGFSVPSWA